jgi:hypothetical protein
MFLGDALLLKVDTIGVGTRRTSQQLDIFFLIHIVARSHLTDQRVFKTMKQSEGNLFFSEKIGTLLGMTVKCSFH